MAEKFASGRNALGICDVCGFLFKLRRLKPLQKNDTQTQIMACPECWNPPHPQEELGKYPINDPQAIRNPRSDSSTLASERSWIQPINGAELSCFGIVGDVTTT